MLIVGWPERDQRQMRRIGQPDGFAGRGASFGLTCPESKEGLSRVKLSSDGHGGNLVWKIMCLYRCGN